MATFQSQYTGQQIEDAITKARQMEETFTPEEKEKVDAIDTEFVQDINQIKAKTDQLFPPKLTYYVDATNGSDDNDGTSEHPFKTIMKAVNFCRYSSHQCVIRIADGTYNENVNIEDVRPFITIRLSDGGSVTINGNFYIYNSKVLFNYLSPYATLTVNGAFTVTYFSNFSCYDAVVVNTNSTFGIRCESQSMAHFNLPLKIYGTSGTTTDGVKMDYQGYIMTNSNIEINNTRVGIKSNGSCARVAGLTVSNVGTKLSKTNGGQVLTGAGIDLT